LKKENSKDKSKISEIIKWLADKAVDVLIAILRRIHAQLVARECVLGQKSRHLLVPVAEVDWRDAAIWPVWLVQP